MLAKTNVNFWYKEVRIEKGRLTKKTPGAALGLPPGV